MDEAKETYDTGTLSKGFKDGSIRHTAVNTFIRHRNDEINVADGHLILIDKVYDDGWIMGRNETLKTRGMFPAACLEETI